MLSDGRQLKKNIVLKELLDNLSWILFFYDTYFTFSCTKTSDLSYV